MNEQCLLNSPRNRMFHLTDLNVLAIGVRGPATTFSQSTKMNGNPQAAKIQCVHMNLYLSADFVLNCVPDRQDACRILGLGSPFSNGPRATKSRYGF